MRENTFYAKKSKCMFGTSKAEYLGHVISKLGVATNPKKIQAMVEWPIPRNIKELRGFLGLTGYYRRAKQFFSIDYVQEDDKVKNVSIHVYDRVVAWHLHFMRNNGDNVSWAVYEEANLKRFRGLDDGSVAELKNLSHKCSGQMFTLKVLGNMDEGSEVGEEEEFVGCEELRHDCNKVSHQHAPHISLNALSGVPTFNIMRIRGMEGSMEDSDISLEGLLQEYEDVFQVPTLLPPHRSFDHAITLKDPSTTVSIRPYRYPPTQKNEIEKMVKEL
nr:retrovirus-related Pol polyprotein from transposon 297 family [Tanacetum cinerariifolium]